MHLVLNLSQIDSPQAARPRRLQMWTQAGPFCCARPSPPRAPIGVAAVPPYGARMGFISMPLGCDRRWVRGMSAS
jgi:hypothetical protein